MPYVFIMPNTKYSNGNWWARLTVGERTWDIDTLTRKLRHAKRFVQKVEAEAAELYLGRLRTVSWAIDTHIDWHAPVGRELRHLLALRDWFGNTALRSIGQAQVDRAARELYPGLSPATWRYRVHTPTITVLRENGLLAAIQPPISKSSPPAVLSRQQAETLLSRCNDADYRAFLTFLFFSGARLGEALGLTWDRLDTINRRMLLDLAPARKKQWRPLHRRASEALDSLPRRGPRIFPWPTARHPQRVMERLRRKTGIHFNHMMARRSFASWLAQEGIRTLDIMDACGWVSLEAAHRVLGQEGERERNTIDLL